MRRVQRVGDELRRVGRPFDDVDLLAAQLGHHAIHALAARADAGAYRVDHRVGGVHRHLRAAARLAGDGLDLHNAALNLRHLQLEQALHQSRMDARYAHLRAVLCARARQTAIRDDLQHVNLEALARRVHVAGHLLARLEHALGLAQLDVDILRLGIDAVHNRGQNLVFLLDEVVVDLAALGLANLLHDDLLGRLRGDAAEVVRRDLDLDDVILLIAGLNRLRFLDGNLGRLVGGPALDRLAGVQANRAGLPVQLHAHVRVGRRHAVFLAEIIFISALQCLFNRRKEQLLADVFFLGQRRDGFDHLTILVFVHALTLIFLLSRFSHRRSSPRPLRCRPR